VRITPARDDPHLRPCSRPYRLHRPLSTAPRSRRPPLSPRRQGGGGRTRGECGEAGGRRERPQQRFSTAFTNTSS
jgi:hypothetical protein